MPNELWGPLAGLIGTWEGDHGIDVSFHSEKGKVAETPYRETSVFTPFGPVDHGEYALYGLDYRTTAYRDGDREPFHREVGYWLWYAHESQVLRCFMVPRASAVIAGATVAADAKTFKPESDLSSHAYGILSSKYLDSVARATRYDVTVYLDGTTYRYDQTTVVEHERSDTIILHTDRNTLIRTSWES
jgi:hypothetical protein